MNNVGYEITPEINGIIANLHKRPWSIRRNCLPMEETIYVNQPQNKWRYKRKSNIDRSQTLNKDRWNDKGIIILPSDFKEKYEAAKSRIIELCRDSDDEYTPNQTAQNVALYTLDLLRDNKVVPSLINSTDDTSLIFEFFVEDKFYLIEFYNSGEIIYLRRIEGQPKFVTEITIDGIKEIVKDITRAYTK